MEHCAHRATYNSSLQLEASHLGELFYMTIRLLCLLFPYYYTSMHDPNGYSIFIFCHISNKIQNNTEKSIGYRTKYLGRSRGVASARLSEANLSLAETLFPPPTNRLSVPIKLACAEVVMCHASHAGTFLEKGWIIR